MQTYQEGEEEIEGLVDTLLKGVAEDAIMEDDQGQESVTELMDVDMAQETTHLPLLVDMCHHSDISSEESFPNPGQNNNRESNDGSEQAIEWHRDVNNPYVNYSEGVEVWIGKTEVVH